MPDGSAYTPAVSTSFPKPIALDLSRAIDSAVSAVVTGEGKATVTASLKGMEASLAYKPKSWLTVGGYAARLWGGGFEAGARAVVGWGGKK